MIGCVLTFRGCVKVSGVFLSVLSASDEKRKRLGRVIGCVSIDLSVNG